MANQGSLLEQLLENSLLFEYIEGAVSSVAFPYTTGMRIMPFVVVNVWQDDVTLEIAGEPPVLVKGQEGMVIPTGIPHRITILQPTICRWAHVHYKVLNSVDLLSLLPVPRLFPANIGERLGEISAQLVQLQSQPDTYCWGDIIRRKELGFSMLSLICANIADQPVDGKAMRYSQRLMVVLRYIQDHLAEDFSRQDLADLIDLSPTHFHTIFKQTLGVAPMEYVKQLRIRSAQRLLVETNMTVAYIGEHVGFHDPFHFSRLFKAVCDMSPIQYRQAIRSSLIVPPTL